MELNYLIVVPTVAERERVEALLKPAVSGGFELTITQCGFGLIESGITTIDLINRLHPDRVILLGVAGAFDPNWIGQAVVFDHVLCDGIGIGCDLNFRAAGELGWKRTSGVLPPARIELDWSSYWLQQGNDLDRHHAMRGAQGSCGLVSVCAVSANEAHAGWRRSRFPSAVAEDMEGYSVALACRRTQVPLVIVRGISNQVGDRCHENWRIETALENACRLVAEKLGASKQESDHCDWR